MMHPLAPELRRLLKDSTGLDLPDAAVERALREHAQRGAVDPAALEPGTAGFEAVVDLVVVPESWMFRDPAVFTAALRFVQHRLLERTDAMVRILSLPCAGGEEPYSMAMALARAGIPPARCRIDAVDLSQAAIARARQGRYTRNAFRGTDLVFRDRWFTPDGDAWLIRPELRDYVCFRQGNLFTPDPGRAGSYDLIFCRNLLIYFDEAAQARAARAVDALLAGDGLLLSGYAEAPSFCRNGFAPAPGRGVFALHKVAPHPRAEPAHARAPVVPRARVPARARAPVLRPAVEAPEELLALARRHADAGQLADAGAACRSLLAARPDHAEAYFLLGLVNDCAGDGLAAEQSWRRCLYLQPDHYEALCSLALLHERRGERALASGLRQRAARIFEYRARSRT